MLQHLVGELIHLRGHIEPLSESTRADSLLSAIQDQEAALCRHLANAEILLIRFTIAVGDSAWLPGDSIATM